MNQGYVCKENMKDNQKVFSGNKPTAKNLPKGEGQKEFRAPSSGDKSVIDRDHGGISAPRYKN